MNSKTVLQKIMTLLSKQEVAFTYARLKDGTIVESPTFDVNEPLDVVSEDGTKTPAPNGEHELELKDSEGNETYIKVFTEDGIIKERENVELADAETKKVEETPEAGNTDKENVMPDVPGQIQSGTIKAAEVDEVSEDMPETDGKPEGEVEEETELAKIEKLAYRIAEMEKKIQAMEEAIVPPVDSEVTEEVAGIKMAEVEEDEEEELPKLDGAPIDAVKMSTIEQNTKNYGKKVENSQSTFLSKLYK
jgi:hypothetical protein